GLPPGRIVGGTLTELAPLRKTDFGKRLLARFAHEPVHGPMLGCLTGTSAKVWVRTAEAADVSVVFWESGAQKKQSSAVVKSSPETDFTAVATMEGLKPLANYHYQLVINGQAAALPQGEYAFHTLAAQGEGVKFRIAFGGGAGFVPPHERMWNTIDSQRPDLLLLLGDNVYIDDPTSPAMQHYTYYRRQSRPEFRSLVAHTPTFTIWDDHDFGTNDCSGGPAVDSPAWKIPVWKVYRNNWNNLAYGGGEAQPGCWYDYYVGNVHFIMLDGRYYRNLKPQDDGHSTMLGPVQRQWLYDTLQKSKGKLIVLASPVPWVFAAKGDSKDTWNGFRQERDDIFDFLAQHKIEGVVLISADRHRSDLWKIDRPAGYPLYEFNSSRLTNQHVHGEMKAALFSYNKKQSFGTVDFDTTLADPTVTYRIVTIDGDEMHKFTVKRSELTH
ncbi:MAG: alkaline phosphatase family protein, partial [Planctomycetales bacterium]|nr:alkaline phosphatase family protein [Planctomycetales bacterium]